MSESTTTKPGQDTSLSQALGLLGKVLAPTTLLTALLYYFGWARTNAIYGYFGIDQSVLGFSSQDYILRSITVAVEPLRWLMIFGLVVSWGHLFLQNKITQKDPKVGNRLSLLAVILILSGAALLVIGNFYPRPMFYPLSWTIGVGLMAYGLSLRYQVRQQKDEQKPGLQVPGWLRQATWFFVIGLLIFGLFWTVADWADQVGRWQAEQTVSNPANLYCATLFSQKPLNLEEESIGRVQVEELAAQEDAFRYKYTGLKLLVRSNDRFFLLPVSWSTENPRAMIIPDQEGVRLELAPGTACLP